MFAGRKEELENIREKLNSGEFELLVIYGRRRVGKTRLILEAVKDIEHVYYLAIEGDNLRYFKRVASRAVPEISYLEEDWENYFRFLKDRTVIIDEFPNLIKENKGVLSVFQRIVDTELKDTKTKLLLSGSSVSMMGEEVLSYGSPLYGRRTGSIKLKPLKFWEIEDFFPKSDIREIIEIYAFADGVPYYLERIKAPFWAWLKSELRNSGTFLKDEMDFLIKYEFEEVNTYKKIIEAIALGKRTPKEIRDYLGLKHSDITPYLRNLIETEFIKREIPIFEGAKSKKGRYYLKDNFTAFWFRYIYPNLSAIEEGIFEIEQIKGDYPSYVGGVFEKISKDFLVKLRKDGRAPLRFNKIGKWWHRDTEIDIVAVDETKKEILFGECKWQENVNAEKILKKLREKAENLEWNKDKRKENYIIFARSFKNRPEDCYCFDIKDMKRLAFQNHT